jgi:small subunit ribosomal protein S18
MATKSEKVCYFCENNMKEIDYKNTGLLRKFVNYHMKILPGKRTGTCSWHQRKLTQAVKRSRSMALLGFVNK